MHSHVCRYVSESVLSCAYTLCAYYLAEAQLTQAGGRTSSFEVARAFAESIRCCRSDMHMDMCVDRYIDLGIDMCTNIWIHLRTDMCKSCVETHAQDLIRVNGLLLYTGTCA